MWILKVLYIQQTDIDTSRGMTHIWEDFFSGLFEMYTVEVCGM